MIKSGVLSQKLPADLDLLGRAGLGLLTVDDATVGSMGNANVESQQGQHNARSKDIISFCHLEIPWEEGPSMMSDA
jgi:hypothetical protein